MEHVDLSFLDEINAALGVVVVVADYIFGDHWILFAAFLALNFFDYFTGLAKAKILKAECSSLGLKGIIKKFSYWCMIAVAFLMAPIFNELGEIIGADVSYFSPMIGYLVLGMMIVNEFRSVLENLLQCGVAVPSVLVNGLAIFEKMTKNVEEKMFDGNLEVHPKLEPDEQYHVDLHITDKELEYKDSVILKICTVDEEDEIYHESERSAK